MCLRGLCIPTGWRRVISVKMTSRRFSFSRWGGLALSSSSLFVAVRPAVYASPFLFSFCSKILGKKFKNMRLCRISSTRFQVRKYHKSLFSCCAAKISKNRGFARHSLDIFANLHYDFIVKSSCKSIIVIHPQFRAFSLKKFDGFRNMLRRHGLDHLRYRIESRG